MSFLIILLGALLAGLGALGWLARSQRRRRLGLSRSAHEVGMRFSATDIFQLSRRYACFVLAQAGHSPVAENVLYGRFDRWQMRLFDYRFEAGHGPRRMVRRYSVIVAETDLHAPRTILWDSRDEQPPPLVVQQPQGQMGRWWVVQGREYAAPLAAAFDEMAAEPLHIQAQDGMIIACSARRWQSGEIPQRLQEMSKALARLERHA